MKNKKIIASVLAATLVVSSICVTSGIDAAKKVKLNAKKKAITVDQSFTLKVKNKAKKAKVKWKVSDKKVLAITAKKVKAKKATAKIKGLAEGTAKVTAKYKLGKKVKKLNCTVTVSAATPVAFSIIRNATGIAKHSTIQTSLKSALGSSSCPRFLLVNKAPVATLEVTEVAMFRNRSTVNAIMNTLGSGRCPIISAITPD